MTREEKNAKAREYYAKNRELVLERNRKSREKNGEKWNETRRNKYAEHGELYDKVVERRERCKEHDREVAKVNRDTKKSYVASLKTDCVKCGYSKENHMAIDFHHVNPDDKEFSIGTKAYSKEKIDSEVSKCVCLCSNCHRIFHYQYGQKATKENLEEFLGKSVDNLYCKV